MPPSKTTPMIKQYLTIKQQYPDAILFYRMGDFYEMFFEDAKLASRVLEITLTTRNKNDPDPVPMCGVPHRAAQAYIARLIDQGYKVAVCDQIEDPAAAKGLLKRDVVRVVTPGMIVEDELLDAKTNNYLLAIASRGQQLGLCYLDISTATFKAAEFQDPRRVAEEVLRIAPREILLPVSAKEQPQWAPLMPVIDAAAVTFLDDRFFGYSRGRQHLLELLNTVSLEGFGCEHLKAAVGAAGALIHYVGETQKQSVEHIGRIQTYGLDHYLMLDDTTFRNLEIVENLRDGSRSATLLEIMDKTVTAMGGRMIKEWSKYPLLVVAHIEERLDAVSEAVDRLQMVAQIRETLNSVHDLERLASKVALGHANARDLTAIKRSLLRVPTILEQLAGFEATLFTHDHDVGRLRDLADEIHRAIREDAPPSIHEGGIIRQGYHSGLDELIRISSDGKGYLVRLEEEQRQATGINSLKVSFNKVFGYYIEIPKARQAEVPAHYVRKQTLVNAERYITDTLKDFEAKVLGAEEQRAKIEFELFNEIRQQVISCRQPIQQVARFLSRVDCLLTLAEVARQNNYVRPQFNTNGRISIRNGRHPVVEKLITGERFVPNSVEMDDDEHQILIITGPNMAGKSTVLRQTALVVVMAQMGSFVPAERASLSIIDRIFTRVGALDNLSAGQSTFMVEMQETANILNNANHRSLVIMDEIGRGTSTYDGFSIAWAVAAFLHDHQGRGVKTLFATHYHELTALALTKSRVKNYNIAVKEWNDEIIFLRKLVQGATNRSYGIQVARLAGVPVEVIEAAKKILTAIETGEHSFGGVPSGSTPAGGADEYPVQLDLFQDSSEMIVQRLRSIDIQTTAPLEALNLLSELQALVQKPPAE